MFSGKTIFISALDWGLGHATRCVPLIRQLKQNNNIIIGTTPLTKIIFDEEFPELEKINVPAYNIQYSSVLPLWMKLISDWPRISGIIKEENNLLEKIISEKKIGVVISDNRFGFHSKKTRSVFISHQLFLKTPFANSFAQEINKKYILNFDEVLIPDFEEAKKSLSGELSHGNHFHKNVKYLGPQSRLEKIPGAKINYDYLFLLSGPEPQKSLFKNILIEKAQEYPSKKLAIVGPEKIESGPENLEIFIAPGSKKLSELICSSEKIICRSGYSTLMDLHTLEKKEIILVPTPGQTEQEYLAEHWKNNFNSTVLEQNKIKSFHLK